MGLASTLVLPEDGTLTVMPALAHAVLNPAMAVVFTVTIISAVLSTIDSAILSPASVLAQNVFARYSNIGLLRLNRLAVLLVATCALGLAYVGENAYALLEAAYALTLVGLLTPMLFALYTQPRSGLPAMASMLVGSGVWLVHFAAGWEVFLQPLVANAAWQAPVALSAATISVGAYLFFEPPWRMRRRVTIDRK